MSRQNSNRSQRILAQLSRLNSRSASRLLAVLIILALLLVQIPLTLAQDIAIDRGEGGDQAGNAMLAAILYMRAEEYEKAIAPLDYVLAAYPEHTAAHTARAESYFYLGNYQAAVEGAEFALSLTPEYARAYWVLGQVYFMEGDFLKAEIHLRRYVELTDLPVSDTVIEKLAVCAAKNAES